MYIHITQMFVPKKIEYCISKHLPILVKFLGSCVFFLLQDDKTMCNWPVLRCNNWNTKRLFRCSDCKTKMWDLLSN